MLDNKVEVDSNRAVAPIQIVAGDIGSHTVEVVEVVVAFVSVPNLKGYHKHYKTSHHKQPVLYSYNNKTSAAMLLSFCYKNN